MVAEKFLEAGRVGRLFLRKAVRTGEGRIVREAARLLVEMPDPKGFELLASRLTANPEGNEAAFFAGLLREGLRAASEADGEALSGCVSALYEAVSRDGTFAQRKAADLLVLVAHRWMAGDPESAAVLRNYVERATRANEAGIRAWAWGHAQAVGLVPEGLAGWWRFDEEGGATVPDSSGRGNDGTLKGGARRAAGVLGRALLLDGKDDGVALGNPEALQLTGDQTISLWIRPASLGKRRNPFAKAYGGEATITVEEDGRINYYYGTSGRNAKPYQSFTMTHPVKADAWTHLVVVRDLERKKLLWYRNGAATDKTAAKFPEAKRSKEAAWIGKGYVEPFHGRIDDLRVYARALTAEQVKDLYELGRP